MSDSSPRPGQRYRPDIDGMRAVAVLLVLVFHFRLAGHRGDAGFLGVDIFFVISGYLITRIVVNDLASRTFALGAFYVHRVRRLAPALVVTVILTLAWAWFQVLPRDFVELTRQLASAQFYVANFYFWQNVNYFGLGVDKAPLLHMWSLAVEEQFYLLFPIALLAVHRLAPKRLPVAILVLAALSFAINIVLVQIKPSATFYLLPTRAWELLVGAGLSQLDRTRFSNGRPATWLAAAGVGAIGTSVLAYHDGIAVPGWYAGITVLGAAAVLFACDGAGGWVAGVLRMPALVYIGRISYPAYLIHWPVHLFAQQAWGHGYNAPVRWGMFAASLLLAAGIYHAIENPVRTRRVLAIDGRLLSMYGATLAISLLVLLAAKWSGGLPSRFPPNVVSLASYADDRSAPLHECEYTQGRPLSNAAPCRLGTPGVAPSWLILGDSHAWAAESAFDQWLTGRGEAGVLYFRHACPPLLGVHVLGDRGACSRATETAMAWLSEQPGVRSVLLVSTWLQAAEGLLSESAEGQRSPSRSIAAFDRGLALTLDRLNDMKRRTYIWEPVPGARTSVPEAMALRELGRLERWPELRWTTGEYRARYRFFFEALDRNAPMIFGRVATAEAVCVDGWCEVERDDQPLYFDNGHITRSSAPVWAAQLQRSVR